MKSLKVLLAGLMMVAGSAVLAHNDVEGTKASPGWVCKLAFQGETKGFQIIIGKVRTEGLGTLKCFGLNGETIHQKVKVSMGTFPLSPTVTMAKYKVYGQSANISLFDLQPNALYGKYLAVQGQASIVRGAGVITAAKIGLPDLTIHLSVQYLKGFGFNAGISNMTITPIN